MLSPPGRSIFFPVPGQMPGEDPSLALRMTQSGVVRMKRRGCQKDKMRELPG